MKPENQEARRAEIEAAAYALLRERGYKATSMLMVARRAGASNQTLYRWYGDKAGLFRAIVEGNAAGVATRLGGETAAAPALEAIAGFGPALLALVTGERAVALNRAAAQDVYERGDLGRAIAEGGKRRLRPLLVTLFERARREGALHFEDATAATDVYLDLLVGDLQIERVIGVRKALSRRDCQRRAKRAFDLIARLYGT